ncbi:MAG: substrate-binding domain-containing protein [Rudanella sp.]|nr:substrate-binding domain-containing protein [Rudanella sp.]
MFKTVSIYWSLVAGLLLLACQPTPQHGKTYRIGFSQCTGADAWRRAMLNDMKRELAFHPAYSLLYEDASNSTARQISQVQSLMDKGIDLLIISPNEKEPFTKIIEAVYQKGIPVILLDRKIDTKSYNAYIGGDNVQIGRLAGAFIGNRLNGRGRVVEIWGLPSSSPAQDRDRGLREALKKFPAIQIVKEINGQWEQDTVGRMVSSMFNDLKETDLVFAHNDVMALGAYQVFRQNGLQDKVDFVGIDALPGPSAGMQAITNGMLTASFLYPTGGEEAIKTATRILEGKAVEREQILNSIQVDASNIHALKAQSDKLLNQQADIEKQSQRINELSRTYTSQRDTLYLTVASLLIMMVLGMYALYLYYTKQTAYRTLEHQNEEILNQKNQIEAVSAQARLATEEKLRFYSYISHEFNTPLGLILTPTEDLLSKKSVNPHDLRSNLLLVQKNSYRLLRLVDQMLDLRKTDAGKQRLHTSEQNLVAFIQDIVQDFRQKADKQRIDLQFLPTKTNIPIWFDTEKLDKVIVNLLSNAFKYTQKNGLIHVRLAVQGEQVCIEVDDNGEGMSPDEQAHAFDLFFSGAKPFNLSKGLGLALSMEFIQLHLGEISVASEQGKGTTFTILLPLGDAHLAPEEKTGSPTRQRTILDIDEDVTEPVALSGKHAGTILVVEDNDDLRAFLTTRLQGEFDVAAEPTGEQGWERALEIIPDLIISDIMLPGLDGLQLTRRVKSDLRTSHIPVILLTARGQMEQRIEGTRVGADAYMTKPFNTAYLLETLRTTLANREKWQRRYASDFLSQSETGGNRQDKKFLNQLTALTEQNLADSDFGVEKLSREMGLSRVQLYRKVQALLDMNVMDYLTQIRLKRAKHLLRETNNPMSEIADATGFSSPAYFTTFFKQHTGKTPSEYRKSPVGV